MARVLKGVGTLRLKRPFTVLIFFMSIMKENMILFSSDEHPESNVDVRLKLHLHQYSHLRK